MFSVHLNTFPVIDKVRGGEKSCSGSAGASQGIEDGAGGPFAIGPRNVNDLRLGIWKCEGFAQQSAWLIKAEFDAELLGGIEPIECLWVGHF